MFGWKLKRRLEELGVTFTPMDEFIDELIANAPPTFPEGDSYPAVTCLLGLAAAQNEVAESFGPRGMREPAAREILTALGLAMQLVAEPETARDDYIDSALGETQEMLKARGLPQARQAVVEAEAVWRRFRLESGATS